MSVVVGFNASEVDKVGWQHQLSDEQKNALSELGLVDSLVEIVRTFSMAYEECCSSRF